MTAIHCLAN